jgi:hypothetical protein
MTRYGLWLLGIFGAVMSLAFFAGFVTALLLLGSSMARAQDARSEHDAGHMKYHPAYSTWAIPGSYPGSCCNMRMRQTDGSMTGDCYPTEYRPVLVEGKFDHWQALLDEYDGGGWVDVPNDRLIREKNPDPSGVSGHICYGHTAKLVYCGVAPAGTL